MTGKDIVTAVPTWWARRLILTAVLANHGLLTKDASTQHYLGIYTNIERLSDTVVDVGEG